MRSKNRPREEEVGPTPASSATADSENVYSQNHKAGTADAAPHLFQRCCQVCCALPRPALVLAGRYASERCAGCAALTCQYNKYEVCCKNIASTERRQQLHRLQQTENGAPICRDAASEICRTVILNRLGASRRRSGGTRERAGA
jgi:hypothetical protein